uniref:LisH domain-containing protein n=1 Tax=Macrostomum lignano TaxID=282301 RepID=A0A1I8F561_9PLAT
MPNQKLKFFESDVIKLVLEFLDNRDLCISMLSLERETGIINGLYSEDMLFLRQLLLDGQSVPVSAFACPFEQQDLTVDVQRLAGPSLEASWAEQLLVQPPKPKMSRAATELLSRSMMAMQQQQHLAMNSHQQQQLVF